MMGSGTSYCKYQKLQTVPLSLIIITYCIDISNFVNIYFKILLSRTYKTKPTSSYLVNGLDKVGLVYKLVYSLNEILTKQLSDFV